MSRGLSSDQINALASGAIHLVTMIKLEFNSTYYFTNHYKTITYDSNDYTSSPFFVDITEIREESKLTNSSIDLTLSATVTTILTDLVTNGHIGKTVTVYLALLDADGAVITNPIEFFSGETISMKYEETTTRTEIVLGIANHWGRLKQFSGRRLTDKGQRLFFSDDPSLELRDQIGKKITWGTQA